LEFKDSHQKIVKCDDKVGSSTWPRILKFPNTSRLEFTFRSDGSGVDWGYKFKVFIMLFNSSQVKLPLIKTSDNCTNFTST